MNSKVKRILNLENQYKKVIARNNNIEKESEEITRTWAVHIYGGQVYDSDVHQSGFSLTSLKQLFIEAGFKNIIAKEFSEFNRGLAVWCEK